VDQGRERQPEAIFKLAGQRRTGGRRRAQDIKFAVLGLKVVEILDARVLA
jgi:hypothetical protein